MIRIPEIKYAGLDRVHFNNIKGYLEDSINFYINCTKIVSGELNSSDYQDNMHYYLDSRTLKSLLSAISTEDYKNINNIKDIFSADKIEIEFKLYSKKINGFLQQLINISSSIYIGKVVMSKPSDLVIISKKILKCCRNIKSRGINIVDKDGIKDSVIKKMLYKIFNYDRFINTGFLKKWSAYDLCEKLDINVCPYCNRIYTFTVKKINISHNGNISNDNIIRPELDHYFPRSKYPMLSLSFFNLIPCCKICNSSIKGENELNLKKYLHPYIDGLSGGYTFDYEPLDIKAFDGNKEKVNIKISKTITDFKSDNNLDFFHIETIYKKHNDIVAGLIWTRRTYVDSLLEEIENTLNSNGKITSKEQLFNNLFNPPKLDEILNRSLGKLNKDIIDKLRNNK